MAMRIVFTKIAWQDYEFWADDRKMLRRINQLIDESSRDPSAGIGKPGLLTNNLSGFWSRRITDEHRLVYQVVGEDLVIVQVRYHY